jgi:hypothetical protein
MNTFGTSARMKCHDKVIEIRVARWYIFIPKIPVWVYFGGPWNGYFMIICNILLPFGKLYGHWVYYVVIWYISPRFGMLQKKKNLATLIEMSEVSVRSRR